ncbi:hypothetical protein [Endozoicomonas sp. Mp262]|uniref:tetratricopeptide repeat protein n=1 Tax=Endozoicomonas sp. Mp262 TaxID=2919499 RepID=UPI0021DA2472
MLLNTVKYRGWLGAVLILLATPLWAISPLGRDYQKLSTVNSSDNLAIAIELLQGHGDPSLSGKAADLLLPLVEKGSVQATLWLGRAYRDGLGGVEKNTEKAFGYFMQAAGRSGKNAEAQYELGRAYYLGEGTDRNLISAYIWTTLSLQQPSSVTEQAAKQKEALAELLNSEQIKTAKALVDQMIGIYLVQ